MGGNWALGRYRKAGGHCLVYTKERGLTCLTNLSATLNVREVGAEGTELCIKAGGH